MNSVASRSGFKPVQGGKYNNGVNGFDHVLVSKNGEVVIIADSKQISPKGTIQLSSKGAGGNTQLSNGWIDAIYRRKLPDTDPVSQLLKNISEDKIKTVVIGVDKSTKEIKLVPVSFPSKVNGGK